MKVCVYMFALSMVAGTAEAQSMIDQFCGQNHINQIATQGDLVANPDGCYVRSLQTQLSHGDPRIVIPFDMFRGTSLCIDNHDHLLFPEEAGFTHFSR